MVIWMLQHRLLTQLHTYVYLIPPEHSMKNGEYVESSVIPGKTTESCELGSSCK